MEIKIGDKVKWNNGNSTGTIVSKAKVEFLGEVYEIRPDRNLKTLCLMKIEKVTKI